MIRANRLTASASLPSALFTRRKWNSCCFVSNRQAESVISRPCLLPRTNNTPPTAVPGVRKDDRRAR